MISEIKNNETKICKKCGRELPLSKYSKIYGKAWAVTCKDCVIDTRTKKYYENGLTLYNTDKSMRTKRNYKTIHKSRILTKAVSGIAHIAKDERFVRLLDYKDTWISNYGRSIVKDGDIVNRSIKGKRYEIICDDEGTFKADPRISAIDDMGNAMLVGNLIVCGQADEEGNLTDLTEADIKHIKEFTNIMGTRKHPEGLLMICQMEY